MLKTKGKKVNMNDCMCSNSSYFNERYPVRSRRGSSFMWSEFSEVDISDSQIIDIQFKERISRLIYPQSISFAKKESKFAYLFSALLKQEPFIEKDYPGKYILIEGNSGTGKTTQAELLAQHLENHGNRVIIIEEPTTFYKEFETFIEEATKIELANDKQLFRLYSIIGDRYQQIHEKVLSELLRGNIVISVRSFISMLVYQCKNVSDRLFVNYLHSFLPQPDIAILYDTTEEICLQRAIRRGTRFTPFDKLAGLRKYRPVFLEIAKSPFFDFPVEIIDVSGSIETVTEKTIEVCNKYL